MSEIWAKRTMFLAAGLLVALVAYRSMTGMVPEAGSQVESDVLAMVGGNPITEADMEAVAPSEFLRLRREVHDLRTRALDAAIQGALIDLEADARGVESSSIVRDEIDSRVEDPTGEEIEAFFRSQNLQGTLEALSPQIRSYLRNQARSARAQDYFSELEDRYRVERFLDPLRAEVASEGFPAKGPEDAPVTIVEFSDFQCPYCRVVLDALNQVEETYGDQVRLVFRQFPLVSIHPQAFDAARASLCAREQGRFWEMHDAMFANQRALGIEDLKLTAGNLGMDGDAFAECFDSGRYITEVNADLEEGRTLGITGTPMIFINGRALSGAKPFEELAKVIDDELSRGRG